LYWFYSYEQDGDDRMVHTTEYTYVRMKDEIASGTRNRERTYTKYRIKKKKEKPI